MTSKTGVDSAPKAILTRYLDGPAQLEVALAGLSGAQLDLALDADLWSIRQYIHHIVDGDDLWKIGIKAALGDTNGVFSFPWYWDIPQDTWAERWAYADRSIELSLILLKAGRQHVAQMMQQIPDAWERAIRIRWPNEQEQQVTAGDIVEMQASHVFQHIEDIQAIREAHSI